MKRVATCVALAAAALLAACTDGEPAATTTSVTSAAPAPLGVPSGVVVASCGEGPALTVAGYEPGVPVQTNVFTMPNNHVNFDESLANCWVLRGHSNATSNLGPALRSSFNIDYSRVVGSRPLGANRQNVELLAADGTTVQLSQIFHGDKKPTDVNAMYHVAENRVYFWDATQTPPQLMSVGVDGKNLRAEVALGKKYPYQAQDWTETRSQQYMPDTAAPIIEDPARGYIYNKAGTLAAHMSGQKLVVERLGVAGNSVSFTIDDTFTGNLVASAFLTDSKIVLRDSRQIYRVEFDANAGSAKLITIVKGTNKDTFVWDPFPSPDGTQVAFLSGNNDYAQLFTVESDGGNANMPVGGPTFIGRANIVAYTK